MPDSPEKACVNCHFFAIKTHQTNDFRLVTEEEREEAREGDFYWSKNVSDLACYRGVWSYHRTPRQSSEEMKEEYVERDRERECFFFRHRPGMTLETAEKLHDRKKERERFEKRNSVLWWSVLIALFGVIVNAAIQLLTLFYSSGG